MEKSSIGESPTLLDARGEKPYIILANREEKPYTNFQTVEKSPTIQKFSSIGKR